MWARRAREAGKTGWEQEQGRSTAQKGGCSISEGRKGRRWGCEQKGYVTLPKVLPRNNIASHNNHGKRVTSEKFLRGGRKTGATAGED